MKSQQDHRVHLRDKGSLGQAKIYKIYSNVIGKTSI